MTAIDPECYMRASSAIHMCAGGALLVLGATEALAADNMLKRLHLLAPAAFILSSALMFGAMYFFLGDGKPHQLREALRLKGGFYIFAGFAWFFTAAGLSRLMAALMEEKGGPWQLFFLALLYAIGLLCFAVPSRVDESARALVFATHATMGATILAAALLKTIHFFRRKKALQVAWAALLLFAAGQLLIYRETPAAFYYGGITIQTVAGSPGAR